MITFQFYSSSIKAVTHVAIMDAVTGFQFYSSSIKASVQPAAPSADHEFQFYSSSIKASYDTSVIRSECKFQFYSSSIKARKFRERRRERRSFNSIVVRLKPSKECTEQKLRLASRHICNVV